LSWRDELGGGSVKLDAQTGLIRDAYRDRGHNFGPEQFATPVPVTPAQQEKAKAAAIAAVQRHYGPLVGELKLQAYSGIDMPDIAFMPEVPFFFRRYVNGIPAGHDGVVVNIDWTTMEWTYLSMGWTDDVAFPKPEGVMTPAQATDRYLTGARATLAYQPKLGSDSYDVGPDGPYLAQQPPLEAMLVYQLNTDLAVPGERMLDARTGEPLDWSGHPRTGRDTAGNVPAGHWANGELRYLLSRRALTPEQMNPDGPLSRTDALRLLMTALPLSGHYPGGYPVAVYKDVKDGDTAYNLVKAAIQNGLLRPEGDSPVFGGQQAITRAEFAVWLARALELDELARSPLVTVSTFTDIADLSAKERNAITFLQALGIAGAGVTFRGSAQLTQAEAAVFTVRVIKHLRATR
jgi:hypothetical protein